MYNTLILKNLMFNYL